MEVVFGDIMYYKNVYIFTLVGILLGKQVSEPFTSLVIPTFLPLVIPTFLPLVIPAEAGIHLLRHPRAREGMK